MASGLRFGKLWNIQKDTSIIKNMHKCIIKNIIFFIFLLIFSINVFAVVVLDDDSSAYVTKSEFESLKQNFDMQIKKYREIADNKIEGAISSYLSKQELERKETIPLPYASWQTVTLMNGTIKPEFTYPGYNIVSALLIRRGESASSNDFHIIAHTRAKISRSQGTANSSRPTIRNVSENNQSVLTNATWDGIKTGWKETITVTYTGRKTTDLYAIEYKNSYTCKFQFAKALCFNGYGYQYDLNSNCTNYWKGTYGYYSAYNNYNWSNFGLGDKISSTLNFDVSYNNESYKHIMCWKNDNWEVYNPTFLNTMRSSSIDNLTANNWFSQTKTSEVAWTGLKASFNTTNNTVNNSTQVVFYENSLTSTNNDYNNSSTSFMIPRIGLINNTLSSSNIYQDDDAVKQYINGVEYTSNRNNLVEGFILGYAKKGDIVVWQPEFENMSSATPDLIKNDTEVSLRLSTGVFGEKFNTTDSLIKMKKVNDVENDTDKPTTTNKKVKLEFKMPKDGFIYVKFFPNLTEEEVNNNAWQVDLDLTACNTYSRKPDFFA